MKAGTLLWGFQDIQFLSLLSKRLRQQCPTQELYVQILDSQKTISLVDANPEEIIRTKYNLNHLYQWLSRNSRKEVIVVIDVFNYIYRESFEENLSILKQILSLPFKFFFMGPKSITLEHKNKILQTDLQNMAIVNKNLLLCEKQYLEAILNSGACCQYAAAPVPDVTVVALTETEFFKNKQSYFLRLAPLEFKHFGRAGIRRETASLLLSQHIAQFHNFAELPFYLPLQADISLGAGEWAQSQVSKLFLSCYIASLHYFKLKAQTPEHKFLMWLLFKLISEYHHNDSDMS